MILEKLFMNVILPIVLFGAALAISIIIAVFVLPDNLFGCILNLPISYIMMYAAEEAYYGLLIKYMQKKN